MLGGFQRHTLSFKQTVESAFIPEQGIVIWKASETHSSKAETESSLWTRHADKYDKTDLGHPDLRAMA